MDRFDGLVIAAGPVSGSKVCGLTLAERARRLAEQSGCARVEVLGHGPEAVEGLRAWLGAREEGDLLVLRATDQVVHSPLVEAVRLSRPAGSRRPVVAVTPEDNSYGGALWIPAAYVEEFGTAVAEDPTDGDRTVALSWLASNTAIASPHGDLARHSALTRDDRAAATKMLFRLTHKKQDSLLGRTINRRISYPITRALLPTAISPNIISLVVLAIGIVGCWFTAQADYWRPIIGCVLLLAAGYLDGCDGEIARLRLETSTFGAWLDTVVDETSSLLFLIALGVHTYAIHPSTWVASAIAVGAVATILSAYVIYYYLVVVAGTGNSQDYPTPSGGIWEFARMFIRRDTITLGAVAFAIAGQLVVLFAVSLTVIVITTAVLVPEHMQLRLSRSRSKAGPA